MNSVQSNTRSVGFPHSEIFGSKPAYSSPKLIAVYHVLHRLTVPRHPPIALKRLIYAQKKTFSVIN